MRGTGFAFELSVRNFLALIFLFVSLDLFATNGRWVNIGGPGDTYVSEIVPDRRNPPIWYARDGDGIQSSGVFRSTDFGFTWKALALPQSPYPIQVLVHPVTSESFTLLRSSGHNSLWSAADGKHFRRIAYVDVSHIFAAPGHSMVLFGFDSTAWNLGMSADGGKHWGTFTNLPLPVVEHKKFYEFFDLVVSPFDANTVYATGQYLVEVCTIRECGYDATPLLLVTRNLGRTWTILEKAAYKFHQDPSLPERVFAFSQDGIRLLTRRGWILFSKTAVDRLISVPRKANTLFASHRESGSRCTENHWLKTTDGGRTWKRIYLDLDVVADTNTSLAALDDGLGGLLWAGNGLFRRDRTHGWRDSSNGLLKSPLVTRLSSSHQMLYAVQANGFPASKERNGWRKIYLEPAFPIDCAIDSFFSLIEANPKDPLQLFFTTWNRGNKTIGSRDGGSSWTLTGKYGGVRFDPVNPKTVYFLEGTSDIRSVYKSTDGGVTQQKVQEFSLNVSGITVDENDPQTVFFLLGSKIYKSADGGRTVHKLENSPNSSVSMEPLSQRGAFLVLTSRFEIYRTLDDGSHWEKTAKIKSSRNSADVIKLTPASGSHVFALLLGRLWESHDEGTTWSEITTEFGQRARVFDLTDPRKDPFYVAADSGIFRSTD